MFGQRNSGGLEEAQAIAGFERGRGDGPAQLRVQRVGGWAGKQAAFGEVKRRPACERAVDLRRRQTVRGDENDFVIGVTVLGRAQLQAQWLGPARQRLIVRGHDAIRRQRHAKEAIERRARGGICIFERPPTFVLPGFENRAPQRQRFRPQIERPALEPLGESFGVRLFEFGKCRARLSAPLQSRLVGMQHQTQFQRAGIGKGLWWSEIAKPILPMRDLLLAFPCGHFGFDQAQVRDAVHEFGIANMAPAQFPRDVKPAIKNVARTLGPQFEFLPIAVSIATACNQAEIALDWRTHRGGGIERLHPLDKRGFAGPKFASEIFNKPAVKRRTRRGRNVARRFVFRRLEEGGGGGPARVRQGALAQFEHRRHDVLAVILHRARTVRRPLMVGKFQPHFIILAAAHDRRVKVIRFDALQFEHVAARVIVAPALARLDGYQLEKTFDAPKQIFPQNHSRKR